MAFFYFLSLHKIQLFMSDTGSLLVSIENKIAIITFSHPASNSFPSELLQKLTAELNTISNNPYVNVIILQSQGNTFCAGASFDELLSITDFETGKKFFSGFANVINAMRTCSKIIIGKIQGKAVGGGVGLASACDFAFAYTEASIKLSEIAIGIGPFVIEPAVSRKIGKTAMTQLTLQPNTWQSADWAVEKGLFSDVFDSYAELDEATLSFAKKLAAYNPDAISEMKKVFWEGTENWSELLYERAAISGKLVLSSFTKNALNEFKK
jgi:methylglutaconyl-CoA hydratase